MNLKNLITKYRKQSSGSKQPKKAEGLKATGLSTASGGRYTRDQVIADYKKLGKTPTEADIKNWTKYGRQGQILVELNPKNFEVRDLNGTQVRVYKNPSSLNRPFDLSNKEGQVFAVPKGTSVASGKNYKLVTSQDGYDYYVNSGRQSGGLAGKISDITGIKEIGTVSKYIPNEVMAAVDPLGVNTAVLFGPRKAGAITSTIADYPGLKESEVGTLQQGAATAMSIALALAGHPYIGAAMESSMQAGNYFKGNQSLRSAIINSGIAFSLAGATDLASRYFSPKTPANGPQMRGPYQPKDSGFFTAGEPYSVGGEGSTIGSPSYSNPSATMDLGGKTISLEGLTPAERVNAQISGYTANLDATRLNSEIAKGFFSNPMNNIALAGLGASIAAPFIQYKLQQKAQDKQNKHDDEMRAEEEAFKMNYLETQMALSESASHGEAPDTPSLY